MLGAAPDTTAITGAFTDALPAAVGVITAGVTLVFGTKVLWLAVKVGKRIFSQAG